MNIVNLICAILLPPLGAYLQVGATKHLVLNLILTFLGWLPGIAHAVWLVVTKQRG